MTEEEYLDIAGEEFEAPDNLGSLADIPEGTSSV
jgi:hypothetical protein